MKFFAAILVLLLCAPALAASDEASEVEATTAITLPVDSVTIYPDGLMAVKRMGSLDVTDGSAQVRGQCSRKSRPELIALEREQRDCGAGGL